MTKYEWETELKRNIHRLPDDEIKRVMEYYGELFDDKAERGESEREIIFEFGNPVDVADKILSEYDGELKNDIERGVPVPPIAKGEGVAPSNADAPRETVAPKRRSITVENTSARSGGDGAGTRKSASGTSRGMRVLLFVLINVLTCFAFFICFAAIWIVLGSLTVAGGAMSLGGVAATVVSCGALFCGHIGAGLAQLGMSVALIGIGILMTIVLIKSIILFGRITKRTFVSIKNWLMFNAPKETENA